MSDTRNTNRVVTDIGEELGLQPTSPVKNTYEVVKEIRDLLEEGGGSSEDIAYIKTKVDTILGDLEDQSNGLGAIKTDTGSIKSTVEDQSNGLGAIKGDTASIKSDVEDLSNGLGAIKTDTASIKASIEDTTTGIVNTNTVVKQIADYVVDPNAGMAIASEVTEGKQEIAGAIVDKGGTATGSDSFHLLATEIAAIPVGSSSKITDDGITTINNDYVPFLSWMFTNSGRTSVTNNFATINDNTITNIDVVQTAKMPLGVTSATFSALTSISGDYAFCEDTKLTSFSAPLLTSISGNNAFAYCNNLSSVNVPNLTTIGNYAFTMTGLTSTSSFSSVTTAGDYAFSGCTGLTSLNFPELVTAGDNCFKECTNVDSIDLPKLETAGSYCFSHTRLSDSVVFPKLETAGSYCFANVTGFEYISWSMFPHLTTVGANCFQNCSAKTIRVNSATSIGSYAFSYCDNLNYVYCDALTTPPPSNVFQGSNNLIEFSTNTITSGVWSYNIIRSNMKNFKRLMIGTGTSIDLDLRYWNPTSWATVYPNLLNDEFYTYTLTKLADLSSSGTTHTIRLGWLSHLTQTNINYAASKGWTITS